MNIGIVFLGAVRECLHSINRNIKQLSQSYHSYSQDIIFSTWLPKKENYNFCGVNYVYDYDFKELEQQTSYIVNTKIYFEQDQLDKYCKCNNGAPALFIYNLIDIAKHLQKNNKKYDYIIRSRHDNFIFLQNVEKYFTSDIWIPPLYWQEPHKYNPYIINDHFFIMPYTIFKKFSEITDSEIFELTRNSHDCEELNSKILSNLGNLKYIDEADIIKYITRDMPDRRWRDV